MNEDDYKAFESKILSQKATKCKKEDSETIVITFEDGSSYELTNDMYHESVVNKVSTGKEK